MAWTRLQLSGWRGRSAPFVLCIAIVGCSSENEGPDASAVGSTRDGAVPDASSAADGAVQGSDATTPHVSFDAGLPSIPADSLVCGAELPFKPPGCSCTVGATSPCWTGPADQRSQRSCKDGTQTCVAEGEFGRWSDCEGEVKDCPPPDPPPPVCGCIPGAVVSCDEDCSQGIFCMPFSTKECLPDGTFGPCRESLVPTGNVLLVGCSNVFKGCFGNEEGQWTGDCSKAFTCGKAPGQL
jgi:hypothetical protein